MGSPRCGRLAAAAVATAAAAAAATVLVGTPTGAAAADVETPWAYFGPTGPAFWASLNPDWAVCSAGRAQSPIDLVPVAPVGVLPLRAAAHQTAGAAFTPTAVLNGFKYNCDAPGSCGGASWAGFQYDLLQAHLHVSSEHTVRGEVFPAEMHLVHATAVGELLVVGVLFEVGATHNPGMEALLVSVENAAPLKLSGHHWASLVPSTKGFCQYAGSLTTPPCAEGVTWLVSSGRVSATAGQLNRMGRALLNEGSVVLTSRPTQPLNGRHLTCYAAA